ncbi:VOC family protein [Pseudomonas schmalbachii]|uniref:Glyoxalase n=1 Tax=Pseudomonas schmalbachii TaxID=2816993 RepID=A0ABS3TS68_9PSED|nr:VOC family protein [Pseudomonas schmalbachii]MBO3276515.1 glyoxalase [Pseudomonas schmalbachii]
MPAPDSHPRATVIPCLRYRDAPAAIEWLCSTFGFQRHLVVADEQGGIAHAQLALADGSGMLMLGSLRDNAYGRAMRQPDDVGGCTQSIYMVVADAEALYRQALAGGAQIVIDIKDEDYGGQGFTCRDLEGHVWSFGTYDPWH